MKSKKEGKKQTQTTTSTTKGYSKYSPENVMKIFHDVFLDHLRESKAYGPIQLSIFDNKKLSRLNLQTNRFLFFHHYEKKSDNERSRSFHSYPIRSIRKKMIAAVANTSAPVTIVEIGSNNIGFLTCQLLSTRALEKIHYYIYEPNGVFRVLLKRNIIENGFEYSCCDGSSPQIIEEKDDLMSFFLSSSVVHQEKLIILLHQGMKEDIVTTIASNSYEIIFC
jgi:hypothetical protein